MPVRLRVRSASVDKVLSRHLGALAIDHCEEDTGLVCGLDSDHIEQKTTNREVVFGLMDLNESLDQIAAY